jgi:septal ring factor EnvC (AmiA/AmiB activator)
MRSLHTLILLILAAAAAALAQDDGAGLAQIKEQELEEVREKISDLKKSMDKSARDRDRLTEDLQSAEVGIAEKRLRLRDLERERAYSAKRLGELDAAIDEREGELAREADHLSAQVRAAYMSGSQEKIKLLLNQRDPAMLGRVMAYYTYFNDYRADNITAVTAKIRELAAMHSEVAAEEARLADLARTRAAELEKLAAAQQERQALLAALKDRMAAEGREIERLAAQEKDLRDRAPCGTGKRPGPTDCRTDQYPVRLPHHVRAAVQRTSRPPDLAGRGHPVARFRAAEGGRSCWLRHVDVRCDPCITVGSRSRTGWQVWACSLSSTTGKAI